MAQDLLADGNVRLCIDPSLNFYDGKCRILVEGHYLEGDVDIVADKPVLVTSLSKINEMFGEGSQLSLALKKTFCTCPNNAEVWALPREVDGAAVASKYTLTITGTATSPGRIDLFMIDSDMSISVFVATGATPTAIAADIMALIPADFPFTPTVLAGVVTFTSKTAGLVGNYLKIAVDWSGIVGRMPESVSLVFTQTVQGAGETEVLDIASALGTCCYDVYALLGEGTNYTNSWEAYLASLWSCDTPQCFGHGYMYAPGSFGTILARATNSSVVSKVAYSPEMYSPPWLVVVAYAALTVCTACSNPELSIQGREYGVLSCLKVPRTCTGNGFDTDEQAELRAAGFVLYGPLEGGSGQLTSPYIYNDITNNLTDDYGRPNPTWRDVSSKRLQAETALQIAEYLQDQYGLALFTRDTDVPAGVFGTNPNMIQAGLRTWAKARIGILFSEFEDINNDILVKTDFEVAPPCQGIPGNLWTYMRYRPPVRINRMNVNMQPKMLDNCVR